MSPSNNRKNKWTCPHCDKQVVKKRQHLLMHSDVKPFACDICDHRSRRVSDLRRHKLIHSSDKPFSCSQCEYSAKTEIVLKLHIKHRHIKQAVYECNVFGCEFRTKWLESLVRHADALHNHNFRPFACSECSYQSKTKLSLNHHISTIHHRKEKSFHCSLCDFKAAVRSKIQTHQLIHSDDKPFKCHVPGCDYRTKWKYYLQQHNKGVHLKIKPHVCDLCGKRFSQTSNLEVHKQRMHSVPINRQKASDLHNRTKHHSSESEGTENTKNNPTDLNLLLSETHSMFPFA